MFLIEYKARPSIPIFSGGIPVARRDLIIENI